MRISLACVLGSVLVIGCGGEDGEPLIAGSLSAEFAGDSFTPVNGYATLLNGDGLIALGDGPIQCGTENDDSPPDGNNAAFSVPLEVGDYSSVFVQMFSTEGGFTGVGSNDGTVTITAADDTSVAGTVSYAYTDMDDGATYALSGSFEVVRCP